MEEIKNWIQTKYILEKGVQNLGDLTPEQKKGLEYQIEVILKDSDTVSTIKKAIEEKNENLRLSDVYMLAITE